VTLLSLPMVDPTRTISNNMWEILSIFGIETARQFLVDELTNTISFDGTFINKRHILLIADIMTNLGTITSISRYGARQTDVGPMSKASFEDCMSNFLNAGAHSITETTDGVSATIMCGKMPKIGTGACELKLDLNALRKLNKRSISKGKNKNKDNTSSITDEDFY